MDYSSIFNNWDIPEVAEVVQIKEKVIKLICVNGTKYLLKERGSIERIYTEEEMLQFLKSKNIPVAPPLRAVDDSLYIEVDGLNYCLYEFMNGDHLGYKSYSDTVEAVKLYGLVLGRLHSALNSYNGKNDFISEMDLHKQVFSWAIPRIISHFNDKEVHSILNDLSNGLDSIFKVLPKQYIHRDFHGENVLFSKGKCTGLIDFDLCVKGFRIFDIGYIMTSILSYDFANEEYRRNWLTLIPIFIESYVMENELLDMERKAIWHIIISIQLIFTAYFTGENNSKLAEQNLEMFYWIYRNKDAIVKLTSSQRGET